MVRPVDDILGEALRKALHPTLELAAWASLTDEARDGYREIARRAREGCAAQGVMVARPGRGTEDGKAVKHG